MPRLNVGIVIENGGVKSLAALPFLRNLYKLDCNLTIMAASVGAAISSLFARNENDKNIALLIKESYGSSTILKKFNRSLLYRLFRIKREKWSLKNALYVETFFQDKLKEIFGDQQLEDLPARIRVQATNMRTADGILFSSGSLADILYASSALFPFLPPIEINGNWYVDGVFSSALPIVHLAEEQHFDVVIAITFQQNKAIVGDTFSEFYANIINRTFTIGQRSMSTLNVMIHHQHSEVLFINIPFNNSYSILDTSRLDEILEQGKIHCDQEFDKLMISYNQLLHREKVVYGH